MNSKLILSSLRIYVCDYVTQVFLNVTFKESTPFLFSVSTWGWERASDRASFSNRFQHLAEQHFTWVFKLKQTCYGFFPRYIGTYTMHSVTLAPKRQGKGFGASSPSAATSLILYSATQFKSCCLVGRNRFRTCWQQVSLAGL